MKEFWKAVWERFIDGAFFVAAFIYAAKSGKLTAEALRISFLDVAYPFIWAMSAVALVHLVRTGILLSKQISAENSTSQPTKHVSGVLRSDGKMDERWEMPVIIRYHKPKIVGVMLFLSLFPIALSYLSWRLRPTHPSVAGSLKLEHTHIQWLGPRYVQNFHLLPLRENKPAQLGFGIRNTGDFTFLTGEMGVAIGPISAAEVPGAFNLGYKFIRHRSSVGTMVAHASPDEDVRYETYPTPLLSKKDIAKLNSGETQLCAVGSVIWKDATGRYETNLFRCMFVQPDHSFNWNTEAEDDTENPY